MDSKTETIQREAWDTIQTPEYWFRKHYNLAPTDQRYLDISTEEILLDFWCHVLYERMLKLRHEGMDAEDITLESLTIDDVFEEEFRKAREEAKRKAETPPEILIDIHG